MTNFKYLETFNNNKINYLFGKENNHMINRVSFNSLQYL